MCNKRLSAKEYICRKKCTYSVGINTDGGILFLVVLFEGSGEVGLELEVFGDHGDGGVSQLDEVKEPLPVRLHPQIVLLMTGNHSLYKCSTVFVSCT